MWPLTIQPHRKRPSTKSILSGNTIAALGHLGGMPEHILNWASLILVVPQDWERQPDPIDLPTSTTKRVIDVWLQTNKENLITHSIVSSQSRTIILHDGSLIAEL